MLFRFWRCVMKQFSLLVLGARMMLLSLRGGGARGDRPSYLERLSGTWHNKEIHAELIIRKNSAVFLLQEFVDVSCKQQQFSRLRRDSHRSFFYFLPPMPRQGRLA